ncbi:hypothetical protein RFI_06386 [Reticulomyxa filosa]|uniref:Uncharacterized protein n=1 Tax=Reticulomyxa filosa TaxID=46433 RepID=X6NXX9_RETFI|nr:hypothetical protein RFI_06386 [Reticulomyxa filosa]|eukprot:ETO30738.1 hypothetical protein RFI_06386 [Reticulomyxa filosa]
MDIKKKGGDGLEQGAVAFGEDTTTNITNLEDEVNEYEFSDDAWLSDSQEHTPPPIEFEAATQSITVEPEQKNPSSEFETVKTAIEKEQDKPKDPFQLTMSVTDNAHQVFVKLTPEFVMSFFNIQKNRIIIF